jgi:DNA mismatch repair protein MutL
VRFRQSSFVHDFVRDTVRAAVLRARPAASFLQAISPAPRASDNLLNGGEGFELDPVLRGLGPGADGPWSEGQVRAAAVADGLAAFGAIDPADAESFSLTEKRPLAVPGKFAFGAEGQHVPPLRSDPARRASAFGAGLVPGVDPHGATHLPPGSPCVEPAAERIEDTANLAGLGGLRPLGQVENSFILAVNAEGLWIVDQHVAHERILFEKVLRERQVEQVQRQRLLMPLLIDLLPAQMANFAGMASELERNGFEAEPFGPRTLAVKSAPVGLEGRELELALAELLQVEDDAAQADNMEARRRRIAASIACHAAVKINMPLEPSKMQWLLDELGKTENPMACPHGRPIALRYSLKEIQRAFQRI